MKKATVNLGIFFHGHYETGKICEYDILEITGLNVPTALIEWLLKDRTDDFGEIFDLIEPDTYNQIVATFCFDKYCDGDTGHWYCEKIEDIFSIQSQWEKKEMHRAQEEQ